MFQLQGINSPHLFINSIPSFTWKWSPQLQGQGRWLREVPLLSARSFTSTGFVDSGYQGVTPWLWLYLNGCPSVCIPHMEKQHLPFINLCWKLEENYTLFKYVSSIGSVLALFFSVSLAQNMNSLGFSWLVPKVWEKLLYWYILDYIFKYVCVCIYIYIYLIIY